MRGHIWIELMVVLLLISVMVCFCLPISHNIVNKNRLCIVEQEIYNAIEYAKIQAMIQNQPLRLAPIKDADDWSLGMSLSVEQSKDTVLHQWHWLIPGLRIRWQGFQSSKYLVFSPEMQSNSANGRFLVDLEPFEVSLVINRLGRVRRESYC